MVVLASVESRADKSRAWDKIKNRRSFMHIEGGRGEERRKKFEPRRGRGVRQLIGFDWARG